MLNPRVPKITIIGSPSLVLFDKIGIKIATMKMVKPSIAYLGKVPKNWLFESSTLFL